MATNRRTSASGDRVEGRVRFSKQNWLLLGVAALSIVGGYALLGGGSTVAAPLLLVLGYVVLIPIGIIRQ